MTRFPSPIGFRSKKQGHVPFNASYRRNRNVLVPQFSSCEVHDILLTDATNYSLDFFWFHPAACGDNLAANVLSHSSSAIKGEKNRSLELGFCSFRFRFGDVIRQAGPFAQCEVDKVINLGLIFCDEVYPPQSRKNVS